MKVVLTSSAKADVDRAVGWYESQKEGLGNRFLAAFLDTTDRIGLNPEGYAKVIGKTRKANLDKFPYALWFKVRNDVLVIACLHQRRDRVLAKERAAGVIEMPKSHYLGSTMSSLLMPLNVVVRAVLPMGHAAHAFSASSSTVCASCYLNQDTL